MGPGGAGQPEAPVLVVQADTCEVRLGGAGAVAGLLRGLEAEVLLAGIVGDDPEGRIVRRLLDEAGIDGRMVLTDADRPTTHKQRFLATVEQRQPHQILRVDHERTHPLTPELANRWLRQSCCARVSDPAPTATEGLKHPGDLRSAVPARSGDLRPARSGVPTRSADLRRAATSMRC